MNYRLQEPDTSPLTVHLALAMWVGLVAGLVVALGGWDDPRPLHNGWIRLMTLGTTAVLLAWAFHRRHAAFGRRLQLAVIVSLMLHTGMAVGLSQFDLELAADPLRELPADEAATDPLPVPPQVTLIRQQSTDESPVFELPIEPSEQQLTDAPLRSPRSQSATQLATELEPSKIWEPEYPSELLAALRKPIELPRVHEQVDLEAQSARKKPNELANLASDLPSSLPTGSVEEDPEPRATDRGLPLTRSARVATDVELPTERLPLPSMPNRSERSRPQASHSTVTEEIASRPRTNSSRLAELASQPLPAETRNTSEAFNELNSRLPADHLPPLPRSESGYTALAQLRPMPASEPLLGRAWQPDLAGVRPKSGSDDNRDEALLRGTGAPALDAGSTQPLQPGDQSRGGGRQREFANLDPAAELRRAGGLAKSPAPLATLSPLPLVRPLERASSSDAQPPSSSTSRIAPRRENRAADAGLTLARNSNRPPASAPAPIPEMALQGRATAGTPSHSSAASLLGIDASPREFTSQQPERRPIEGIALLPSRPLLIPEVETQPTKSDLPSEKERRPAASFKGRVQRIEQQVAGGDATSAPRSEAAIERGLDFLKQLQQPAGNWAFDKLGDLPVPPSEVPNVQANGAATGLSLLAMLGGGYDHFGGKHQEAVKRGLAYLVTNQNASGEIFPEDNPENGQAAWQVARFYSHGIATLALCEAYGMTGDPELQQPAQRAIDYIERTQVDSLGGWRYTPGLNSDLSVTGWQLMALKSGDLAGLKVQTITYRGIRSFVESCREKAGNRARFCYNPNALESDSRTRHGRKPGTVMTSVGMLADLYLGRQRTDSRLILGGDHLRDHLPTVGDAAAPARTSTLGNPLRDTYYWYYGTQVMYQLGGEHWHAWNDALRPILLGSQSAAGPLAGSWDPAGPVPDKWGRFGGRIYVTAMNLLSLEVRYRHLPLYEQSEVVE